MNKAKEEIERRIMILAKVEKLKGLRLKEVREIVEISERTIKRWRKYRGLVPIITKGCQKGIEHRYK